MEPSVHKTQYLSSLNKNLRKWAWFYLTCLGILLSMALFFKMLNILDSRKARKKTIAPYQVREMIQKNPKVIARQKKPLNFNDNFSKFSKPLTSKAKWLCIVIPTIGRPLAFLEDTLNSIFDNISQEELERIKIVVANNALDGKRDPFIEKWKELSEENPEFFSNFLQFVVNTSPRGSLAFHEKHIQDYAFSINQCINQAPYVMLMEDDAVVIKKNFIKELFEKAIWEAEKPNFKNFQKSKTTFEEISQFFSKIEQIPSPKSLSEIAESSVKRINGKKSNWVWVKAWFEDEYRNWEFNNVEDCFGLFLFSFTSATIAFLIDLFIIPRIKQHFFSSHAPLPSFSSFEDYELDHGHERRNQVLNAFAWGFIFFLGAFCLANMLGKTKIASLDGLRESRHSGCLVAQVFPSDRARELAQFMKERMMNEPVDLFMRHYANWMRLRTYIYSPYLFRHAGSSASTHSLSSAEDVQKLIDAMT